MKNFLAKKGIGFYFTAAAVVLGLIGVILYGVSRENVSVAVTVLLVLAVATGAVVAVKPFKFTEFVPLAFGIVSFGMLLVILLDNIAEIAFKNNMLGLSGEFVAGLIFIVLALIGFVGGLVAKQEKE